MDETSRQEIVEQIEIATLQDLLNKIKSGEATAADRTLAWNVCKDNGVLRNLKPSAGSPAKEFLDSLPHFPDEGVIGKVG